MAKKSTTPPEDIQPRPPIVVVMGHIDHGKSTLLDYIRETKVVETEAGGITQHMSAYEVEKERDGAAHRITFIDTPGHEAFGAMRSRGARVADIAILVVAADDGVKEQTKEALQSIREAGIPFVVAINKVDKQNANVQMTINSLIEHEVYLEGYGGDISYAEISAKTGQGVNELLDLILLAAELEDFKGDRAQNASGVVIESNIDPKKGVSATLIIRDGSLRQGMYVQAGTTTAPVRMMEDFAGKRITEATFSSPIRLTGFTEAPTVGERFNTYNSRKEAEQAVEEFVKVPESSGEERDASSSEERFTLPVVIKADVAGSLDALKHEIKKLETEFVSIDVLASGLGAITDSDVRRLSGDEKGIVLGFNVSIESSARDVAERFDITLASFSIIYELSEWLAKEVETRRPRRTVEEIVGKAKVLKIFSERGDKQVIGCRLLEGRITRGTKCNVLRRENNIARGIILGLQRQKSKADEISTEEEEFGMEIESRVDIAPGDILEVTQEVEK